MISHLWPGDEDKHGAVGVEPTTGAAVGVVRREIGVMGDDGDKDAESCLQPIWTMQSDRGQRA